MGKKLISFLGITDYIECNYCLDQQRKASGVKYIQEALAQIICSEWLENDSIVVLLTEEAKKKNWHDDGHIDKDKRIIKNRGLKTRLEDLNLKAKIVPVEGVPEGKTQNEIWEIFEILFKQIEDGDEIVFDITNALRSIPTLAIIVLNYARTIKNIKLSRIYYGAFDVLGNSYEEKKMNMEEKNTPIFDLTPFIELMDWTTAVNNFVKFGAAEDIKSMCTTAQKQDNNRIEEFGKKLNDLDMNIRSCRGPEIIKFKANELKETIKGVINEGERIPLPVLNPLMKQIVDKLSNFNDEGFDNGYAAVKWCIEHNLVQQGYTILNEMVINTMLKGCVSKDKYKKQGLLSYISDYKIRNKMSRKNIEIIIKSGNEDVIEKNKRVKREVLNSVTEKLNSKDKLFEYFSENKEIQKAHEELKKLRNDMDHAGFSKKNIKPEGLKEQLEVLYNEVMKIIDHDR